MKKTVLTFLFILFGSLGAFAGFQFNDNCTRAYQLILELKLKEAGLRLQQERRTNPSNSLVILLENYRDYYGVFASDSKDEFEGMQKRTIVRLDELEKAESNSPWYQYSLAQINMQLAFLRAKYQEYWGAAWAVRRASGYLDDLHRRYPAFAPAEHSRGLLQALLGSVPSGLRLAMGPLGLHGNTPAGIELMETSLKKVKSGPWPFLAPECALYSSYIQCMITENAGNYDMLTSRIDDNALVSPLSTWVKAAIAIKTAHTAEAISVLEHRPQGGVYEPFLQLDYQMGVAKLNRLDSDAISWFRRFLGETKGVNFVKDSYLRIGWICLLQGKPGESRQNMALAQSRGYQYADRDRQAQREAAAEQVSLPLLKARLLFDGGFYEKAASQLAGKNEGQFTGPREKLEFLYRSGRISEAMKQYAQAIRLYQTCIAAGRSSTWYFAANASLHLGMIYELLKENGKAISSYRDCLTMPESEYKSSIDNKARAALQRLKN